MPDVDAVSVCPTSNVPLMVGVPVAAVLAGAGPGTVISSRVNRRLPSLVQIAPGAVQSSVACRTKTTAASEDGWIVNFRRSFRRFTRWALSIVALVTWKECCLRAAKPTSTGSLKRMRKVNGPDPLWLSGTS